MKDIGLTLSALLSLVALLLVGCSGSDAPSAPVPRVANVWQNPYLSPNPNNNIHSDSYLSDSYAFAGPTTVRQPEVSQVNVAVVKDPLTGKFRVIALGECASQAFDAQGNIQTICAGVPGPNATSYERYVTTIDRTTLQILALYPFTKTVAPDEETNFGGAGYFYQDSQYRMVVAMPDGHLLVLRRTPSTAGGIDGYTVDADYDITGTITAQGYSKPLELYAVMPDKDGNIWFTTSQAVVGTITLTGAIRWIDLNDYSTPADNPPVTDSDSQTITNSHAVDEGDSSDGPSGVYILTTHRLYRLGAATDGTPSISWFSNYDRGSKKKSGQVSQGSGTSPTIFRIGSRRFVTIADNATYMNVNVYRAEITLQPGEQRLFAQAAPFGNNEKVSDENSLIVAPGAYGASVDIYAENNYGNDGFDSTTGSATTEPGFARLHLRSNGSFTVASVNNSIAVPSVVSKISLASNTVYTYNKTADGWYLTGLDADNLNNIRFTTRIGPGSNAYNNYYAALALDSDGKTVWVGTLFGLTRIQLSR